MKQQLNTNNIVSLVLALAMGVGAAFGIHQCGEPSLTPELPVAGAGGSASVPVAGGLGEDSGTEDGGVVK